jgi:hypothetical protein
MNHTAKRILKYRPPEQLELHLQRFAATKYRLRLSAKSFVLHLVTGGKRPNYSEGASRLESRP